MVTSLFCKGFGKAFLSGKLDDEEAFFTGEDSVELTKNSRVSSFFPKTDLKPFVSTPSSVSDSIIGGDEGCWTPLLPDSDPRLDLDLKGPVKGVELLSLELWKMKKKTPSSNYDKNCQCNQIIYSFQNGQ